VAHEDIKYEQACILYNLGALHSMLGAMDKRVSEEVRRGGSVGGTQDITREGG